MESIGDKLKSQRELKGYSIEQIARDTNITKRYLEALEVEDFSAFPGDPYLIGFLRNYADYLGLDPDEMVTLYKNFKIQSQPVPMDELLVKRDKKPLIVGLLITAVAAILGVSAYFLVPQISDSLERRKIEKETAVTEESPAGTVYTLKGEMIERRFLEKDVIQIPHKGETYEIQLTNIGNTLNLTIPGGTMLLRVGDERAIDLDGDANMDIKIAVNDILADAKQKSAALRLDMFVKSTPATVASEAEEIAGPEPGNPGLEARTVTPSVISEAEAAEPFSITFTFKGYCLFRYLVDDRDREERYFQKGDTVILDVTRKVILWMSNAGNVTGRTGGNDVAFGRPGEVSVQMIHWVENADTGKQTLLMQALY